jgi:hypothetical protein
MLRNGELRITVNLFRLKKRNSEILRIPCLWCRSVVTKKEEEGFQSNKATWNYWIAKIYSFCAFPLNPNQVLRVETLKCSSFILNGKSTVVRSFVHSGRRFICKLLPTTVVLVSVQYRTTVQFCCTCAVNKYTRRTTGTRRDTHHGHYKGTHSRAFQGRALRC